MYPRESVKMRHYIKLRFGRGFARLQRLRTGSRKMDTNNQDKEPNWEKRLENLRQTRRMNTAPAYVPLTKPSEVGKEEPIPKLTMQTETVC